MGSLSDKLSYLAATKEEIANAIIEKNVDIPEGTTFRQYGELIRNISGGGDGDEDAYNLIEATITENGTRYAAIDDNCYGYSSVTVNVPPSVVDCDGDPVTATSTVNFKGYDNSVLQAVSDVPLLGQAKYTGETPKPANYDASDPYGCDQFIGWYPSPTFIIGNTDCKAQFVPSSYYGGGYGYRKCVNGTVSYENTMDSENRVTYTATSEQQYIFFVSDREGFFGNNTSKQSVFGWVCNDGTYGMTPQSCINGEVTGDVQCNVASDIGTIIHQFQQDPDAFFTNAHTGGSVIHDTWEEICENKGAKYNIGDYKMLYLPAYNCHLKMIKVYEYEDVSTSTWLCLSRAAGRTSVAYSSNQKCLSWKDSDLRTWLNNTYIKNLPTILQASIKPVTKYSRASTGNYMNGYLDATVDSIWAPSIRELTNSAYDTNIYSAGYNIIPNIYSTEAEQITYRNAIQNFATSDPLGNVGSIMFLRTTGMINGDYVRIGQFWNGTNNVYDKVYCGSNNGNVVTQKSEIAMGFCL